MLGVWALTASVDSCAEIKSGVTKSGRAAAWRKVPESDARSVNSVLVAFALQRTVMKCEVGEGGGGSEGGGEEKGKNEDKNERKKRGYWPSVR